MSYSMSDLLQLVVSEGASDLHVRVNTAPTIRVHGILHRVEGPSLTPEDAEELMRSITSEDHIQQVNAYPPVPARSTVPLRGKKGAS